MAKLPTLRKSKATPSRQVTGTQYTTKGAVNLPPADQQEIGSARSSPVRDPVPALSTDFQAQQTYTKMVRDDASVRVSLRAGKAPVLGAEFYVEPFSRDPQDLAIAEFVDFNLFHGMTTPWLKVMEQILKFYETPKANSIFELVWENREWAPKKSTPGANLRVYTMLRKIAYRPSSTIKEITYDDNGGPFEVIQNAQDKTGNLKEVKIPINKAVIFTFDPEGGSVEGTSILRSAYRSWFYKDHMYKIDGVQKERHGIGIPVVELQPGYSDEDELYAIQMARNLRTNERAYAVTNVRMKLSFADVQGNLVNALESAQHHDTMIMKNIMVQFLNSGLDSSGGGRSTSATAMDMFLKAMSYVANSICEAYNLYVIPPLVAYNFPTDRFPKICVRGIGQAKDLTMFASALANLISKGAIVVDLETQNWIRRQFDMPETYTEEQTPAPGTQQPTNVPVPVPAPTGANGGGPNVGKGRVTTGNIGKSPSSGAV